MSSPGHFFFLLILICEHAVASEAIGSEGHDVRANEKMIVVFSQRK
jgi:hypothetical protein